MATVICSCGEMRSLATSAFRMGETYGSTSRGQALIRRPSKCALSKHHRHQCQHTFALSAQQALHAHLHTNL